MRSTCIIQRISSSKKAKGCENVLKTLAHFDMLATRTGRQNKVGHYQTRTVELVRK